MEQSTYTYVVSTETMDAFKNSLDKHCSKIMYDVRMSYNMTFVTKPECFRGLKVDMKSTKCLLSNAHLMTY